jgi:hypothetical protein
MRLDKSGPAPARNPRGSSAPFKVIQRNPRQPIGRPSPLLERPKFKTFDRNPTASSFNELQVSKDTTESRSVFSNIA